MDNTPLLTVDFGKVPKPVKRQRKNTTPDANRIATFSQEERILWNRYVAAIDKTNKTQPSYLMTKQVSMGGFERFKQEINS